MRRASFASLLLVALLSPAACTEVTVPDTTSGAGGSTSSSSSTSSSTSSSSSGADGCDLGQNGCEAGYCDFPDGLCGKGSLGVCSPPPVNCTDDCPGVCGCDGVAYCNACEAAAALIDVSPDTSCLTSASTYSAVLVPAGLDHLMVKKADAVRDVCVILFLDAPMDNGPGFEGFTAPQQFGATNAIITNSAADCATNVQPMGEVYQALGGKGVLDWTVPPGMFYPCTLTIDASLDFTGGPPWAQPIEILTASDVPIEGSCF